MRVLVTGASGQVGGAIARHLADRGHDVAPLAGRAEIDIGRVDAADRVADAVARCDALVHAAAAVDHDPHAPAVSLANCLGTQQMVQLAARWGVERLVYVSGVTVIGRPRAVPVTEEHPVDPPTAYHASKLYGERLVELARRRGLPAATLRLTAPVGPGTPASRVLTVFVRRARAGEPLEVLGRGSRRQDYVDVRDAAAAVDACLERGGEGCFNVGRGETTSNLELAERCVEVVGSGSAIEAGGGTDPEEGVAWEVSIERARRELGYAPRCGIEDSIRAVAEELEAAAS